MGVTASAISRVTGVEVSYKNFNVGAAAMLPQRLAIIGVGNTGVDYSTEKYEVEASAADVAERYGYGSPLHLAVKQLFPVSGKSATFPVTIYPVKAGNSDVAAEGSIAITGPATKAGSGTVTIGGIEADFAVTKGETAAELATALVGAINAVLDMPVTAAVDLEDTAKVVLIAKWKGANGNRILLGAEYDAEGITLTLSAMADGAGVPSVSGALALINTVWETMILNTFDYNDSGLLDEIFEFGNGRWGTLVKKPILCATGCVDDYSTRTAITDLRTTDYINFLVVSVGSKELPWVIAAKAMVNDILTTADSNPAQNYKGLLTGLKAGADSAQEDYTVRNMSVNKGSSTNIKNGSVAQLNDIITMYHPASEGKYPSKRYVVDLIKLMNVVYNVRLIMEADSVVGAPLVSDTTVTTNPSAIQPKTVKGWFANLANSLALKALISDQDFTKKNTVVEIDSENPKRLNVSFPVKLSGNVEVASVDVLFGFYLG